MPGLLETPGAEGASTTSYTVAHQKVELDINFTESSVRGKTEITIHPDGKDLKIVKLHLRQCKITKLHINGKGTEPTYADAYDHLHLHSQANVYQHHLLSQKVEPLLAEPAEPELSINILKHVRITEMDPDTFNAQNLVGGGDAADGPQVLAEDSVARYTPFTITIEYIIGTIRDGFHFCGTYDRDGRYPHAYTSHDAHPGTACCLFPCVDDISSRCSWEISIRCPRTLGDVYRLRDVQHNDSQGDASDVTIQQTSKTSTEDESLDMVVVCTGEQTDDLIDPRDSTRRIVSFGCTTPLSAQHIGFAVGPFERVNLAEFRDNDEDDKLGQSAVDIYGYCLPGRAQELRNTCLPTTRAIDSFTSKYGTYPFSDYKMCFVDDLVPATITKGSMTICSTRLLFPDNIIDPIDDVTRQLVYALASQWVGIHIIPLESSDTWVVVGLAYFITDVFLKELCGNNEYRFRMKERSDRCCEMDYNRPSLYDLGSLLQVDPSELDFMSLKAPVVLFILDRRIAKFHGFPKMQSIIARIFMRARTGDLVNGALSTEFFQKVCEKFYHAKIDDFLAQWVRGAGCPRFRASQRFNKKKLTVEMTIRQVQDAQVTDSVLQKNTFMRDVREERSEVYEAAVPSIFTGPMTIRIHEADGTPYEHIVEIKEAVTKIDIPYNTKYKRLKRSKRQKERALVGIDLSAEAQDDVLVYCLGDVLQAEDEVQAWRLEDWSPEEEEKMGQESYEWIRMDADFEWMCKMELVMPGYMYLSQLQQDRDVVAQLESIQFMAAKPPHQLISTILVRTLMDRRYFNGIRTTAAKYLAKQAREDLAWIGLFHLDKAFREMFCLPDSPMPRSNDFSNRATYNLQLAIMRAISSVRDSKGRSPMGVKQFLHDKLKFNDNTNNQFSDCYYVSALMTAICDSLMARAERTTDAMVFDLEEENERTLEKSCLTEIDRYRRMDEWTTSYQNIYSCTALDCQRKLTQAKVVELNAMHFLQYTRPGTFDVLRIEAFRNLVELGIFGNEIVLRWFLYTLSHDPSPLVRNSMHTLFWRALSTVALGADKPSEPRQHEDELIIEQEAPSEVRQADYERKRRIPVALQGMKQDLEHNKALEECLWNALTSSSIGLREMKDLLDICGYLYDERTEMKIVLRYPRYWKVEHIGKGKMKFSWTNKIRTKSMDKWTPPSAPNGTEPRQNGVNVHANTPPPPTLPRRITFKNKNLAGPTSQPVAVKASEAPPAPERPVTKLKIKFRPQPVTNGQHAPQ